MSPNNNTVHSHLLNAKMHPALCTLLCLLALVLAALPVTHAARSPVTVFLVPHSLTAPGGARSQAEYAAQTGAIIRGVVEALAADLRLVFTWADARALAQWWAAPGTTAAERDALRCVRISRRGGGFGAV